MSAVIPRPLRAADLVPGRVYRSPAGRLCRLQPGASSGFSASCFTFVYLSRDGSREIDDHFSVRACNSQVIAKLQEVMR